jgi:hypothetical protein
MMQTRGRASQVVKTVKVTTNDPARPEIVLFLKAYVRPRLESPATSEK